MVITFIIIIIIIINASTYNYRVQAAIRFMVYSRRLKRQKRAARVLQNWVRRKRQSNQAWKAMLKNAQNIAQKAREEKASTKVYHCCNLSLLFFFPPSSFFDVSLSFLNFFPSGLEHTQTCCHINVIKIIIKIIK
jgi:type IV secretory pathway VirB3-like protein